MLVPLLAFAVAMLVLLRQDFLFDTDPYLHLAMARYVSVNGFPSEIPYVELMGGADFNYLSEKWVFISLISVFYKIPIQDILVAKIFIAAVFAGIVFFIGKILEEVTYSHH